MPDAPTPPTSPTPSATTAGSSTSMSPGAAGPVGSAPAPKPQITIEDFLKVDLRVARVVKAEPHPSADKLLKLQVDDGTGVPRQICAGIREYVQPEQLLGRTIIIVANLAPRVLRGEESRGMLLAASVGGKDDPARTLTLLTTSGEIAPGAPVS